MKLPRDVSGDDLVRSLHRFGYETTRQTGSHIRLSRVPQVRFRNLGLGVDLCSLFAGPPILSDAAPLNSSPQSIYNLLENINILLYNPACCLAVSPPSIPFLELLLHAFPVVP